MEYDFRTVELPKTAAAWEEGDVDELGAVLEDELHSQYLVFLEDACQAGGAPSDDFEIVVNGVSPTPKKLVADVTIHFTEEIPSGCSDMPHQQERDYRVKISLDRDDTTGFVEASDSEPENWDLPDRNSAADGR